MMTTKAVDWKELLSRRFETPGTALGTYYFSQRFGALISALAFRIGATPNQLTLLGMLLVFLGCLAYASGSLAAWVAACLIWQTSFALDCADGQLARAKGMQSDYGAWLDLACDHVREVVFGLTILYVLLQAGMPLWVAMAACGVLASGNLLYLQTASTLRSSDYQSLRFLASWTSILRNVLRTLLDMPVYMFLLFLFRGVPELLLSYVLFHGVMQGLRAVTLAQKRIAVAGNERK